MDRKTILGLAAVLILIGGILIFFFRPQNNLNNPQGNVNSEVGFEPSKTLKTFTDPAGFSFNYPDNLSIYNNELKDADTYAQLQLAAKGVDGKLSIKIADSKLKTVPEGKEVSLGNLKGNEVEGEGKITLNALDSGVLFTIEVEFGNQKDYWKKVYSAVLKDFTFTSPTDTSASAASDDSDSISFEGEEVVE